jgi:hypothetical protein
VTQAAFDHAAAVVTGLAGIAMIVLRHRLARWADASSRWFGRLVPAPFKPRACSQAWLSRVYALAGVAWVAMAVLFFATAH